MRIAAHLSVLLFAVAVVATHAEEFRAETIIALERALLDRWYKGDPLGYLGLIAPDATSFDPQSEKRLDSLVELQKIILPLTGKIRASRYEMIDPKVQRLGEGAVLTYNLVSYGKTPDGAETVASRWNSTEVYGRVDGKWKIVHSHFSLTKPVLAQ
jgi:hypothetical protein